MSKRAIGSSPQQPYLFYIVLVGVGLGTVAMGLWPRLALLSAALAVVNVVCGTKRMVDLNLTVGSITRGSLLGLVVALPLLVFLAEPLRVYTQRLYVTSNTVLVFYQVCFVSAPLEEFFFRGIVQEQVGPIVGSTLYALMGALYFLPHVPILVTLIVVVAMGLLGIVYSMIRERHGVAAAIASHVMIGFVLQVLPLLLDTLRPLIP